MRAGPGAGMALLEIGKVTRRFGDSTAVNDVSISIEAGEFFTLLGPSGCGKTTLLRMIAGFDVPDAGRIIVDGQDMAGIPPEARNIHTVFQSYALFPHMNVEDNIAFPLRMAKADPAQISRRVEEALEDVRLTGMNKRYPNELSGGQKQRVAVARALINRPKRMLLDEPLAALDAKLKESVQLELIGLQKEVGITFVYVTHDQSEALALSHRIAVMNQGRVEQVDEPSKIYGFPRNRFVADFVGQCNLLEGEIRSCAGERMNVALTSVGDVAGLNFEDEAPELSGALALRPEKVAIGRDLAAGPDVNRFAGNVHAFLYLADRTIDIVQLAGGMRIEAFLPNSPARPTNFFHARHEVQVAWRYDAGHFLNE